MFAGIKQMAKEAGRDPSKLAIVVRANLEISEKLLPKVRAIFTGTMEQIKADAVGCREIGADELFFDPTFAAQTLDHWLGQMEQLRRVV
jgi:hypothetical protein